MPNPVVNPTLIPSRVPIPFPSTRDPASEVSVAGGAEPNPVVNPTIIPSTVQISFPSARDPAAEVLQLMVAVPKTGQKNALPREDATEVPVGRVPVPKTFR